MKKTSIIKHGIICALALTALISCKKEQKTEEPKGPVIIAYVGGYKGEVDAAKIAANKITHINYAFANVVDGKAVLANEATDASNFQKLNQLKGQNPNLKILLSIGGWSWSKNFSDAVLTPEGQKAFAKSAIEIISKYNLDGVDIDWEYPAIAGEKGNIFRPEDKQNYTLMFEALRAELNSLGEAGEKKYLLTTAVGAFQEFIDNTEMDKVQGYLDYVNIMAYDYQDDKKAIHHANLYPSEKYKPSNSAKTAIDAFIQAGVPTEKLVLGIPFYGRVYTTKKGASTGIGDPIVKQEESIGYPEIKEKLVNKDEFYRYWDDAAQAPYLFNFYKSTFITYEDEVSVKIKCEYVRDNNMGGVMFWEYFSDPKGYLLDAINEVLK